mgnify:CR=1 FL=1
MSDVLQTNIFFFITAIAAVCTVAVAVFALYRLARFLKGMERISQVIEEELYILRDDVADARSFVRNEGIKFKHVLGFMSILFTSGNKMKGRERNRGTSQTGRGRERQNNNMEKNNGHE